MRRAHISQAGPGATLIDDVHGSHVRETAARTTRSRNRRARRQARRCSTWLSVNPPAGEAAPTPTVTAPTLAQPRRAHRRKRSTTLQPPADDICGAPYAPAVAAPIAVRGGDTRSSE